MFECKRSELGVKYLSFFCTNFPTPTYAHFRLYQTNSWPFSANCGQDGFKPNTNPITADEWQRSKAWETAWNLVGFCLGSMGPTSSPSTGSPNFSSLENLGTCQDLYSPNQSESTSWKWDIHITYKEGDIIVSDDGLVYQCRVCNTLLLNEHSHTLCVVVSHSDTFYSINLSRWKGFSIQFPLLSAGEECWTVMLVVSRVQKNCTNLHLFLY